MIRRKGMGSHQGTKAKTETWLTPRPILDALGPFDLDPCAAPDPRPWPTAGVHYALPAEDGLSLPWFGRVWLNPPYGRSLGTWLSRLVRHGTGTALIFARTDTDAFHAHVWEQADALLFLKGRLHFHLPDGSRGIENGGAPSVLIAYGPRDAERLLDSGLDGAFVGLKRSVLVHLAFNFDPPMPAWRELVLDAIKALGGKARLTDVYASLEDHPKVKANPNWRAKVRQTVARARLPRLDAGLYAAA